MFNQMQICHESENHSCNPLQANIPGYSVVETHGRGLQKVLRKGDKFFRGRIYSVKQFNRILAAHRELKLCMKDSILCIHKTRYISPSLGIVITPNYSRATFAWARDNIRPVMFSVLHALFCCHGHGIVHRNVNFGSLVRVPDEELIADPQNPLFVRLTNFKYAIHRQSWELRRPVGPLHYRAPETWGRTVPLDAGTALDIWSVGVMFLELLLDAQYIFGDEGERSREMIIRGADEALAELSEEIDDEHARDLLQNLLRTDYRKRFTALEALLHPYFGLDTSGVPPEVRVLLFPVK